MGPEKVCFLWYVPLFLEAPVCALGSIAQACVCRNMMLLETPARMDDHAGRYTALERL